MKPHLKALRTRQPVTLSRLTDGVDMVRKPCQRSCGQFLLLGIKLEFKEESPHIDRPHGPPVHMCKRHCRWSGDCAHARKPPSPQRETLQRQRGALPCSRPQVAANSTEETAPPPAAENSRREEGNNSQPSNRRAKQNHKGCKKNS